MKVKIRPKISIGFTTVNVKFVDHLHCDEGFDGTYNRRTGELAIERDLQSEKRDKTFGHELMEVIKHNYELSTSEDDMSRIANGWLEFLRDNLGIEFDWSEIE